MRRWPAVLIFVLCVAALGAAQQFTMITYERVQFNSTIKAFTASKILPNGQGNTPQASVATCRVSSGEARYQLDGASTSLGVSSGVILYTGDTLTLAGFQAINAFRVVTTSAADSGFLDCIFTGNQ